ncbi:MAG TPA: hypothetical protein VK611_28155 [Acidimicrobiales bacterium]|nr:hypothetical protein [Acidimicrobiales bacterium]
MPPPLPLPPPPLPLPPPPPPPVQPVRLGVGAAMAPSPLVAGETATVVVTVRNDGAQVVDDVRLVDVLSAPVALRSASSPAGTCAVVGRRADCRLGRLAPGDMATAELRVVVDREPASRTVVQQISLNGVDRSVSTLVRSPTPAGALLDLPGPTVTLVAFFGFVLASRFRPA